MKTRLRLLFYGMLVFAASAFSTGAYAQIDYSEDFEGSNNGWSDEDFEVSDETVCNGDNSLFGFFYNYLFWGSYTSQTVSPSVGVSNGQPAVLEYSYKILDWDYLAYPNSPDWGTVTVEYATSPGGPWTVIESITPSNHTESDDCATRTANFTPPPAGSVYLRITAAPSVNEVDVVVIIDDVVITQGASVACTDTPVVAATTASTLLACTTEDVTLSLTPVYSLSGLDFQWQYSTNGTDFTDVATGGTSSTYSITQTETTWYRALVSCSAGGDEVPSTPIQVVSSGLPCYCGIEFTNDVEPITLVNFAGINNTTSATVNATPDVEDFTSLAPGIVAPGETYPITLKGNTAGDYVAYFTVYIDFNHNGSLDDPGESFEIGTVENSTGTDSQSATGNITIPEDAMTGLTYMRVFKLYNVSPDAPCGTDEEFGYGQAEDYLLNIGGCSTEAPDAEEAQEFCEGATVADLSADGIDVVWYADAEGGVALTGDEPLVDGNEYYAAQIIDECESELRTSVSVTINVVDAPAVNEEQTFCNAATVGDLNTGELDVLWYADAEGGTSLAADTALADGVVYHAAQVSGDCESTLRTAVTVVINTVDAPAVAEEQIVCGGSTVEDLDTDDMDVVWYADAEGGIMLEDDAVLVDGVVYYAAQLDGDCESVLRTPVTVELNVVSPPTGDEEQIFNLTMLGGIFLDEVEIEAEGTVNWYESEEDALAGEDALGEGYTINTGTEVVLYATQTIDGCESAPFAVEIQVLLGVNDFDAASLSYYPNPVKDVLAISYKKNIDTVEVYNLIGQQVMVQPVNNSETSLDMSGLAAGTYMVKITADGNSKNIKIVKQ